MDRRSFLAGLGTVIILPLTAEAQPAGKVWRIGILTPAARGDKDAQHLLGGFIRKYFDGNPDDHHVVVTETGNAVAFLNKHPPLFGSVLVAPKEHFEEVAGSLSCEAYLQIRPSPPLCRLPARPRASCRPLEDGVTSST